MDRARMAAAAVSIVLIGAALEPLVRDPRDDGFPLSTYPMFATKRATTMTLTYALGEGRAGERVILSPELVGTGEVLQAMRVFERAVASGTPALTSLCQAIARRVAADHDLASVAAIRIVSGTHDALLYLGGGVVGREGVRLRCEVVR